MEPGSQQYSTWSAETMWRATCKCLAEDGRHVSIAVQRGSEATIYDRACDAKAADANRLDAAPARRWRSRALVADELARTVWPFVAKGELKPQIDATFPLVEAAEAHRRMETGDHVGKIVLTMG